MEAGVGRWERLVARGGGRREAARGAGGGARGRPAAVRMPPFLDG